MKPIKKQNYESCLAEYHESLDGHDVNMFTDSHWRIDDRYDIWTTTKKFIDRKKGGKAKPFEKISDVLAGTTETLTHTRKIDKIIKTHDYRVICETNANDLTNAVLELLKDGWQPHGSAIPVLSDQSACVLIYQTLIRK